MAESGPIDTSDMLAVHAALRADLGELADLVSAVGDGDTERAAVVAEHYGYVMQFLEVHHHGEDALLWPVLRERRPDSAALFDQMAGQHAELDAVVTGNAALVAAWTAQADAQSRQQLADGIGALASAFGTHTAQEEADILPIAAVTMTAQEWANLGDHARGVLMAAGPQVMGVALGSILDRADPAVAEAMLAEMPPPARDAWESQGAPAYRAYRQRLAGGG